MFSPPYSFFTSEEAEEFYSKHQHDNLEQLLLKFSSDVDKRALSLQLEARKRAETKLITWHGKKGIVFPPKQNLEQASSEITANYKANILPFKTSVDLTGGTGIDSWQFAIKAEKHTLVEPDKSLCAITAHNFDVLNITNTTYINSKAEEFLATTKQQYDLLFIDPSRRSTSGKKVIALHEYEPNVIELKNKLLETANYVLIKVSPFADLTYLYDQFKDNLVEFHVVAVQNECKEILILLTKNGIENPHVKTINFNTEATQTFQFNWSIKNVSTQFCTEIETYLYEPNAAILKSGAFGAVANAFRLNKLDANAHLFSSTHYSEHFPGNIYKVLEVAKPYKLKGVYHGASIISKNYPEKPDAIRKRLKMAEGKSFKIFATTFLKKRVFIVAKKIMAQS